MFKKLLIIVLAFILAAVACLFFFRRNAVVYRFEEKASVDYSGFVILNPFRDKGPEIQAEQVLLTLNAEKCVQALSLTKLNEERIDYLCLREGFYPLQSWSLMDRLDSETQTDLIYHPYRKIRGDTVPENGEIVPGAPIRMTVVRTETGWQPTTYDTYY